MSREEYGQAYQKGFDCTVRFLLSRGVQRDMAMESAQAAWVRGWERLYQLRDENMVLTWVNSIALNLYRGGMRRETAKSPLIEPRVPASIDLAAIDVARILESCRPSDRMLLQQYLHGVTTKEIADRQGATETAIRIRLLRARRTARALVEHKKLWAPDCTEHAASHAASAA